MYKTMMKKADLESQLKKLKGIENPNMCEIEKISRIETILKWIDGYLDASNEAVV